MQVVGGRMLWTGLAAAGALGISLGAPGPLDVGGYAAPAVTAADPTAPAGAVAPHVIVISIDGLRPDAVMRFRAPTLQRLMREGSYSLTARTILPSTTLPSHASMLTGRSPARHGVSWNDDLPDEGRTARVPTIFTLARREGLRTAAFVSKSKFQHLVSDTAVDFVHRPARGHRLWSERTSDDADDYLERERPHLLFVHIADVDRAGHSSGWMSAAYARAVTDADEAVEDMVGDASEAYGAGNFTVVVTADHGGHGKSHGSADPRDVTIPWIAWGRGVAKGTVLPEGIRTMDTGATALWLLGVPVPASWEGVPVTAAFTPESRRSTRAAALHPGGG